MSTGKAQKTKELELGDLQSSSFYRTKSRWESGHEKEGEEENTLFSLHQYWAKKHSSVLPYPLLCHVRKASRKGVQE